MTTTAEIHTPLFRQIEAALRASPDMRPAAIARQLNCSRAYVAGVARQLGLSFEVKTRTRECTRCGRRTTSAQQVCSDCRWVTYACSTCGTPVRRRVAYQRSRAAAGYSAKVYCSRKCQHEGMRK